MVQNVQIFLDKPRRVRFVGHAARISIQNVSRALAGKPEGKVPLSNLGKYGRIILFILKKQDVRDWSGFNWLRVESNVSEPSISLKSAKLLAQLGSDQLLNDSVPQ
jgi:hypothetical protein